MATMIQNRNLGTRLADAISMQDAAINAALRESVTSASSFFASLADAFGAYRERRVAYRELSSLNDRELADLGISRADIRNVVNGSFSPRS
ncbi:MAG TPA: DUF1127 domain-containing protein [Acetobacteraceae bacterium]|nr:DUF1127 domain-containing protein [Acetobacteraceae bacterium]